MTPSPENIREIVMQAVVKALEGYGPDNRTIERRDRVMIDAVAVAVLTVASAEINKALIAARRHDLSRHAGLLDADTILDSMLSALADTENRT